MEYIYLFGGGGDFNAGGPVDTVDDDSHDLRHGEISGMAERSRKDLCTILVLLPRPGNDVFFVFLDVPRSKLVPY